MNNQCQSSQFNLPAFSQAKLGLPKIATIAAVSASLLLSGCAATQVAISKHELDVQTKMSATIFLDPVTASKRTVFVQIRNTSDKPDFDLQGPIKRAIADKGYRVIDDPDAATYVLQANILQVGKAAPTAAESALRSGYGGGGAILAGASAGALMASNRNMGSAGLAGALIGGVLDTVANAAVKDVYFSIITDIQIKERNADGKTSQIATDARLSQGTSGGTSVTYSDSTNWRAYQTRIVSTANKVNNPPPPQAVGGGLQKP